MRITGRGRRSTLLLCAVDVWLCVYFINLMLVLAVFGIQVS